MSHCRGCRVAVVARTTCLCSVGVDVEPNAPLPEGVLTAVSLPEERVHLRQLARICPDVQWERLLFSVKESVYKTWFPLTGRWLDFDEAMVVIDPDTHQFRVQLTIADPGLPGIDLRHLEGRWLVEDGLLLTAIAVAAPAALRDCPHGVDTAPPSPAQPQIGTAR